ncbi:MAG: tRNA dihydrouridine synthase DusB [Phycisphaerales bacterium]
MIAPRPQHPHIAKPLTVGPLQLRTNLLLAPVANYCDLAWRLTCRDEGAVALACTDLLSPQGLLRGTARSLDIASTTDDDAPLCMQLYGGDPDTLADGAVWAVKHGADVVDINMGCPVDKVTKKDGGSKLLCDVPRTLTLVDTVARAIDRASKGRVPLTAKLRLGWDRSCIVAPDLARALEQRGVTLVTVHGRTTDQRFKGAVDHDAIRDVVQAVDTIPVIGNGDVTEPEDALTMIQRTGCHGVMIGRGSFSAPWLFRRAWNLQTTGDPGPEPDEAHKIACARRYFDRMLAFRDERYALHHIRTRISWIGKRLGPCKPLKERIRTAQSAGDVHRALDEFIAGNLRVHPITQRTTAG